MKIDKYIITKYQNFGYWKYVIKRHWLFGYRFVRKNWSGNTVNPSILSSILYKVRLFDTEEEAIKEINNILYKKTIER